LHISHLTIGHLNMQHIDIVIMKHHVIIQDLSILVFIQLIYSRDADKLWTMGLTQSIRNQMEVLKLKKDNE
jgi:hypothetical protein